MFFRSAKLTPNDRGFAQGFALCKIPDVRSPEGLRACAKPRSMIRKPVGISYHRFGALRGCGLNIPKLSTKHQCSKIGNKLEFNTLPRNLAKLLLYAVPSIRQGWFFGLEWRKFILFLSVGKSGKRKSSFAILGFALGVADCKCAFSCAVANFFLFVVAPVKCILAVNKLYFSVSRFIVAVCNIMYAVAKILNTVINFVFAVGNIINAVANFINAVGKSINAVVNFIIDVAKNILLPCILLISLDYFKF